MYLVYIYRVFLTVKSSSSVWDHSVHFRFSPTFICILEKANRRVKLTKFGPQGQAFSVYIVATGYRCKST